MPRAPAARSPSSDALPLRAARRPPAAAATPPLPAPSAPSAAALFTVYSAVSAATRWFADPFGTGPPSRPATSPSSAELRAAALPRRPGLLLLLLSRLGRRRDRPARMNGAYSLEYLFRHRPERPRDRGCASSRPAVPTFSRTADWPAACWPYATLRRLGNPPCPSRLGPASFGATFVTLVSLECLHRHFVTLDYTV